ncbi:hypothetical protein Tsubulata_005689 [Turnera subulata]|uniref:NADP-dependent oxidoreductase domain-containing protein n=1 Tax=Turnera subulata TaxID=218843 RepID=A0A9Q0JSC8_9ROSI|nr:hypothetical protein Tsubulata_005689 [Turnera subulata]
MAAEAMKRIKLGSQGFKVSAQRLGSMSMFAFYRAPKLEKDMIALSHHAINTGITFHDTSDMYGPHTNEILLGKVGDDDEEEFVLCITYPAKLLLQ